MIPSEDALSAAALHRIKGMLFFGIGMIPTKLLDARRQAHDEFAEVLLDLQPPEDEPAEEQSSSLNHSHRHETGLRCRQRDERTAPIAAHAPPAIAGTPQTLTSALTPVVECVEASASMEPQVT